MQIKIYFDEKPVFLCDEITAELMEILKHPNVVFIDHTSTAAIVSLLKNIEKEDCHAGVLFDSNFEKLKKLFFKYFTPIEAAGGIIQNSNKEILFIYRLDKWDLPKGKIEKNETPELAAQREIEEETGVTDLTFKKKITETYHTYKAFGKHYLKSTHWFYFTINNKQDLKPQLEENITLIKWFKTKDIKTAMDNTYGSIKTVLVQFFDAP